MQAEILPYQPVAVMSQSPGQCPSESENDRRLYVPSLSQSLTRRDIFTHFSTFGGLERVCVKNGVDSLNYAIVLFVRSASMQLAIAANPHSIKGHRLLCRKAAVKNPCTDIRQLVPPTPVPSAAKPPEIDLKNKPGKSEVKELVMAKPPEVDSKKKPEKNDVKELAVTKKTVRATPERLPRPKKLNSKQKENLMVPKEPVIPQKGEQTYQYAVGTLSHASRWRFNLARSFTTQEEKEALKDGHPSAAIHLLKARTDKRSSSSSKRRNFIKPTKPSKTDGNRKNPSWIPAPISNPARFPVSLPPPSPPQAVVSTHQATISISKCGPKPVRTSKLINSIPKAQPVPSNMPPQLKLALHMPDLSRIPENSYFGPDFRYEHHCYTNVIAYQKTKLYVDLEPGEWVERQTIKEFMDEKYGAGFTKH